jgi:hypothetical protein
MDEDYRTTTAYEYRTIAMADDVSSTTASTSGSNTCASIVAPPPEEDGMEWDVTLVP